MDSTSRTPVGETKPNQLHLGDFAAGSMGPKVKAVVHFVEQTGRREAIGNLDNVVDVIAGTSGTKIRG